MASKQEIFNLYKEEGETPLACLQRFRKSQPQYKETKMTYVGRLDPLACGVMVILVNDVKTDKEPLLNLDKVYEFECLWGFETDTGDILGKVGMFKNKTLTEEDINDVIKKFIGKRVQTYPSYSSKTFLGKPLFMWAREGKIKDVIFPKKNVEIFSIEIIGKKNISQEELFIEIQNKIGKVTGDFRQGEISALWHNALGSMLGTNFLITKMKAKVSSGTYIRAMVSEMGKELGSGAVTFSIKRVSVGPFLLKDSRRDF